MLWLDRVLFQVERTVILVAYSTLILVIGLETVRRAVTGEQAAWGPEIALYSFIWLSWFSMAKHMRYGTHLAFIEVRKSLPSALQRVLEIFDCILWLVVGAIIIGTSYGIVLHTVHMGQVVFGTSIPLGVASVAVPIGWAFSMIRILQRLYIIVRGIPEPDPGIRAEFIL